MIMKMKTKKHLFLLFKFKKLLYSFFLVFIFTIVTLFIVSAKEKEYKTIYCGNCILNSKYQQKYQIVKYKNMTGYKIGFSMFLTENKNWNSFLSGNKTKFIIFSDEYGEGIVKTLFIDIWIEKKGNIIEITEAKIKKTNFGVSKAYIKNWHIRLLD